MRLLWKAWCAIAGCRPKHPTLGKQCRRCDTKLPGYCDHQYRYELHTTKHSETSESYSNVICELCGVRAYSWSAEGEPTSDIKTCYGTQRAA